MPLNISGKIVGLGFCMILAGCAQPAQKAAMVPGSISPAPSAGKYHGSVSKVSGFGGEETNPMWTSEISSEDFQAALVTSLVQAGIFSSTGRYTTIR